MSASKLIRRLLDEEKVRGVYFGDVLDALRAAGCLIISDPPEGALQSGKMLSLKHPMLVRHIDIRDNGQRPMHGGYIDDAADYLSELRDHGGLALEKLEEAEAAGQGEIGETVDDAG
jgi:hypothetical protein